MSIQKALQTLLQMKWEFWIIVFHYFESSVKMQLKVKDNDLIANWLIAYTSHNLHKGLLFFLCPAAKPVKSKWHAPVCKSLFLSF